MFTIRPDPCAVIGAITAWARWNGADRLTRSASSHCSRLIRVTLFSIRRPALLTSQSTRPRCATSLATSPWQNSGSPTSPGCTLTEPPRPDGATLADLVADRGGHPSDVLADWLLDNDVAAGIVGVGVANADPAGVAGTLTHPASVMANSDAGAHLQMMCAIGDTTLMLTRYVRDRGDMSVEQAVHRMTGQLAELFGFA